MSTQAFVREFIAQSQFRIAESSRMVGICLDGLTDEEVWSKPNRSSNSIANLMLHIAGNMRQYIIASIGGVPDIRQRDLEFSTPGGMTLTALSDHLENTVQEATVVMDNACITDLLQPRVVQGFHLTGIGIIIHVTEHYAYHTGQIALLTKWLKNRDLGFYAGYDLG